MKVYGISKGMYSDWRIVKMFLSKKKAETFVEAIKDDGYEGDPGIVEFDTDDDSLDLGGLCWKVTRDIGRGEKKSTYAGNFNMYAPEGHIIWRAEWDGELKKQEGFELDWYKAQAFTMFDSWRKDGVDLFEFYITAPSKEAALKIATERYGIVRTLYDTQSLKRDIVYSFPSYKELQ